MKRAAKARGGERFIGLDVHKRYVTIRGMNAEQDVILRPRDVVIESFHIWAEQDLRSSDEVVLEATTNTWDINEGKAIFASCQGKGKNCFAGHNLTLSVRSSFG